MVEFSRAGVIATLLGVASVAMPLCTISFSSFPASSAASMSSFPLAISASEPTHWAALFASGALVFCAKGALGLLISSQLFSFCGYINPAFPPLVRLFQCS